tara:strand:+ start:690 stop:1160 length:471 start_codon:yes stop_codon:yes gene_type:complete
MMTVVVVVMAAFVAFQLLVNLTGMVFQLLRVFMLACVVQFLDLTLKVMQFFPQDILVITVMMFSMIVVMATFIAFQLLAYFTNVMFQLLRVFMFPCVMQLLNLTLKVVQFFPQGILMITIMMFSMVVVMATFMFPMFFVSLALVLTFLPALLMVAI